MTAENKHISRRDFLKLGGLVLGSLALRPLRRLSNEWQELGNLSEDEVSTGIGNPEFLSNKTIETEGRFKPNKPITIYNFPLRSDLTFDPKQKIAVFEMPPQANLSYRNFYFCRDASLPADQQIRRMTIIPYTMGTNNLAVAELDHGKFDLYGNYRSTGTEHLGLSHSLNNILGDVSYIVGDEKVYPNKILNLLNAMAYILEGQEQSGPLQKGQINSYLELIRLTDGANYIPGYNSNRILVRGGGICAGATAVSNAFWSAAKSLGIDYKDTYQDQKWNHPELYRLGHFGSNAFITDTTVQINVNGTKFDYNMIPPRDLYINIRTAIMPNGVAFSETNSQGLYIVNENGSFLRSDVQFILNVALTTDKPQTKAGDLRAMRQQYIDFRSTNHLGNTGIMGNGCHFVGNYSWQENKETEMGPKIYPEQDTHLFSSEIAHSSYLQDIITLQQILNGVDETNHGNISKVVRNSGWYQKKVNEGNANQKMESAINQLDYVHIKDQPVQCVGWAILIAGLPYPNMPVSIGGADIRGPAELIPNSILTYPDRQTAPTQIGGLLIAERDMEISEINGSDLFLMRGAPGSLGHVGVILSRKNAGGKDYLLVTESNRHSDGRIQIFTVDEYNFNAKLGMPPEKKFCYGDTKSVWGCGGQRSESSKPSSIVTI